jgi:phage repressor protein C with HTH and peptisase S24 domain
MFHGEMKPQSQRTVISPDTCDGTRRMLAQAAKAQEDSTQQPAALATIALRYPEKTFYLGQVFQNTTNSYKLVWFLAILSLLRRTQADELALADILAEMAVVGWHPVCLFRLSLGCQDKLQHAILAIQGNSLLAPNEQPDNVRNFVNGSPQAKARLASFRRFVPTRFLSPWFTEKLRTTVDASRDARIHELAKESQTTPFASPYWFNDENICLNPSWQHFLTDNMGVVQAFAEHHLAVYLQTRNPNVPGVVNKLRAPTERRLNEARQFWQFVRAEFAKSGRSTRFRDIYSEQPLAQNFSIDHFLPWSFVVHDLFWNLTPVEPATNSAKNDVLPDLDLYLPRLANLHFEAIEVANSRPKLLEDYTDCFRLDAAELAATGASSLETKFREVILPQAQIAMNQGFQSGWRMRTPVVTLSTKRRFVAEETPNDSARLDADEVSSERVIVELFPKEAQPKPLSDYLPYYSLAIAAGGFLAGDAPEPEGWVNAAKHGYPKRLSEGMFVTRVVGESMAPTIKNGSYCVFRSPVEGSRQGRIVLVQRRNMTDSETGGSYTVKRYESTKSIGREGWRHESIRLIPDNPDREKYPILEFSPEGDADLQVIAEFIQMLSPTT